MLDQRLIARQLFLFNRWRKNKNRRQRSEYVRELFMNRGMGESNLIMDLRNDPHYHYRVFRMDKENFDWIFERVKKDISHKNTHARPISALERLGITICYLASGMSQFTLGVHYRLSPSSICVIINETIPAIVKALKDEFLPQPTEEMWKRNEERFSLLWNYPNACGSIDGKHIRMKAPPESGSLYYNYKSFFSIVLLAIADADFKFSAVDIGAYGSESDGGILWKSNMGKKLQDGSLGLPPNKPLGSNENQMPYVLLGDDAFPLRPYMMKPYQGNFPSKEHRIFNYRLSRARMTVENSFGILAARWRVFHTTIAANVELVKQIVMCTVLLHNFLMAKKDLNDLVPDRAENGRIVEGNWRSPDREALGGLAQQGSNNYSMNAAQVRDSFKEYFVSSEGSVPWQDTRVNE